MGLRGLGVDNSEIEAYVQTLRPWHAKGMIQPVEKAAWKELPVACSHTTTDLSIPAAGQQSMVEAVNQALENTGRKVQTFTVESEHCPKFSATESIVDAIRELCLFRGLAFSSPSENCRLI